MGEDRFSVWGKKIIFFQDCVLQVVFGANCPISAQPSTAQDLPGSKPPPPLTPGNFELLLLPHHIGPLLRQQPVHRRVGCWMTGEYHPAGCHAVLLHSTCVYPVLCGIPGELQYPFQMEHPPLPVYVHSPCARSSLAPKKVLWCQRCTKDTKNTGHWCGLALQLRKSSEITLVSKSKDFLN